MCSSIEKKFVELKLWFMAKAKGFDCHWKDKMEGRGGEMGEK